MRAKRLRVGVAVVTLALAGLTIAIPKNFVTRNQSASLDPGIYLRVPWAKPEPGSIVMFPIPERAKSVAKMGKMNLDVPLLKRVISVTEDGSLIVKGDCGGGRSLDSRYFGSLEPSEVTGVYVPIPGTLTPCQGLVKEEEKQEIESPTEEEVSSQIKRVSRRKEGAMDERQKTAISGPALLWDASRTFVGA